MPKIYVHTPFRLKHKGETHDFPPGVHTVPVDVADHWYTKAHTGEEPATDSDTSAAADAMLAELDAKEKALAARAAEMDAREGVVAEREQAVQRQEAALAEREQALAEREQAAQNAQSGAKDEKPAGKPAASK